MAAKHDSTRDTFFVVGAPGTATCVARDGNGHAMPAGRYPEKKTWTVCAHLCSPEKALQYHAEETPILIVHGFVFCQECNNRNILTGQEGFNLMLRGAVPQDDMFFQRFIMKEDLPDAYCYWAKLRAGDEDPKQHRRQVCMHLSDARKLHNHYAASRPLFWHQGSLVCSSCFDALKNGETNLFTAAETRPSESYFTETIVGALCWLNRQHFGIKG